MHCAACHGDVPAGQATCPGCGAAVVEHAGAGGAARLGAELAPGTEVGGYVVKGKLGEGGMGTVYSAVHPVIGKKAAIKVISLALCADASSVERFVQEARSVNQIGHPNIVDVFSFGELPDGRRFFVMEWLQGETVADRMDRGPIPLLEALAILDQVADALDAAHEKGVVHRDLKPDNVFIVKGRGDQTTVKLLDFGIAKLADASGNAISRTRTGTLMGTPGYMSPEQARGRNVDARADLYSLGCVAFQMLLGRLPFEADNPIDMVMKQLQEAPPRPSSLAPGVPPALDALLVGLLEKQPEARPTIPQVRAVLAGVAAQVQGGRARSPSLVYRSPTGPPVPLTTPVPRVGGPGLPWAQVGGPGLPWAQVPAPAGQTASEPAIQAATAPAGSRWRTYLGGAALVVVSAVVAAAAVIVFAGRRGDLPTAPAVEATPAAGTGRAPALAPDAGSAPLAAGTADADPRAGVGPAAVAGTIVVSVNVPARIALGDEVIARAATSARIPVPREGSYELRVSAEGRASFSTVLKIAGGVALEVPVELVAAGPGGRRRPGRRGAGAPKPRPGTSDYTLNPFGER